MRTYEYGPGYSVAMLEFVAHHSAEVQAEFFLRHSKSGMNLLEDVALARCEATGHAV